MGVWGTLENENDDFLDYIEDDTSTNNLIDKLKKTNQGVYIVGIVNVLKPIYRKRIKKEKIKKALHYLNNQKDFTDSWNDPNSRLRSIEKQKRLLIKLLKNKKKSSVRYK